MGAGNSRNIGISNSKGGFVAFIDADDLWKNDKLSNSSKETSNISTRTFVNIKNSNSARIVGDEEEYKETHQQGSKLGFNNDRIHSSAKSPKEMSLSIRELEKQDPFGYVLDLRSNPG